VSLRNLLYSVLVDQLIISPSEVIASSSWLVTTRLK
jgi:hypothetical protein